MPTPHRHPTVGKEVHLATTAVVLRQLMQSAGCLQNSIDAFFNGMDAAEWAYIPGMNVKYFWVFFSSLNPSAMPWPDSHNTGRWG